MSSMTLPSQESTSGFYTPSVLVEGKLLQGEALLEYAQQKGLCTKCVQHVTHTRARKRLGMLRNAAEWIPLTLKDELEGNYTVYKGYCLQPTCWTLQQVQEILGEHSTRRTTSKSQLPRRKSPTHTISTTSTQDSSHPSEGESSIFQSINGKLARRKSPTHTTLLRLLVTSVIQTKEMQTSTSTKVEMANSLVVSHQHILFLHLLLVTLMIPTKEMQTTTKAGMANSLATGQQRMLVLITAAAIPMKERQTTALTKLGMVNSLVAGQPHILLLMTVVALIPISKERKTSRATLIAIPAVATTAAVDHQVEAPTMPALTLITGKHRRQKCLRLDRAIQWSTCSSRNSSSRNRPQRVTGLPREAGINRRRTWDRWTQVHSRITRV